MGMMYRPRRFSVVAHEFTPLQLYAGDRAGLHIDPSVFTGNFTTSAGSTSADDPGDPIGRIVRLAGSLNLTQGTDASRPTLARHPRGGIRNRVLNNMGVGAVAGSPGTAPTGVAATTTGGAVIRTIGVPYVEDDAVFVPFRYQFSGAGAAGIQPVASTIIPAANGQSWSSGITVKLSGGSYSNITTTLTLNSYTAAGAFVAEITPASSFVATTTSARHTISGTIATALAERVNSGISITAVGAADITIDVAVAQIEQGLSPTAIQYVRALYDVTESGQPDVWLPYFDGSNDFLTTGVQSFGTASLFADAGQEWTVWGALRTTLAGGNIIAKASATAANRTLQIAIDNSGFFQTVARGAFDNTTSVVNDGAFHTFVIRWNGASLQVWIDENAPETQAAGAASEESEDITIACRTASSPAGFFSGRLMVDMIDRALSDAEVTRLMAYLNNTYRYGL